jgi:cytochrome c oxidase subunit II
MTLKSIKLSFAAALVALFALSACGKSNNNANSPSPSGNAPASSQVASGGLKNVTLTAKNWEFSQPEIRMKSGDILNLTLKSEQGIHGFQAEDLGVILKNGETIKIKLDKAGTHTFHCNIQCGQGHPNMVGKIIVE